MPIAKRRFFLNFTDKELEIIRLRTTGVKIREIAQRLGLSTNRTYDLLVSIYRKAGIHDIVLLTRWAIEMGLDQPVPDTAENTPEPEKKRRGTKPKVRMRRIREANPKPKGGRWKKDWAGMQTTP